MFFCGKEACRILGYEDVNDTLLAKVKQAYEIDIKSQELTSDFFANPIPHHESKAAYISEPGLYQLLFEVKGS